MNVSQFYVGEISLRGVGSTGLIVRERSWGLPPPPRGRPPVAMMLYYLYKKLQESGVRAYR
jgi:hypothetical protein